jgi:hypothetical protein
MAEGWTPVSEPQASGWTRVPEEKSAVSRFAEGFKETTPIGAVTAPPSRMDSGIVKEREAEEAFKEGKYGRAALSAAESLPLLGSMISAAEERLKAGDIAGTLGMLSGAAVMHRIAVAGTGGSFVPEPIRPAAEVAGGAAKGAAKAAVGTTEVHPTFRGMDLGTYSVPDVATGAVAGGMGATAVGLPKHLGAAAGAVTPIVKGAVRGAKEVLAEQRMRKAASEPLNPADQALQDSILTDLNSEPAAPPAEPPKNSPLRPPLKPKPAEPSPAPESAPPASPPTTPQAPEPPDLTAQLEASIDQAKARGGPKPADSPVVSEEAKPLNEDLKAKAQETTAAIVDREQTKRSLQLVRWLREKGYDNPQLIDAMQPEHWNAVAKEAGLKSPPSSETIAKVKSLFGLGKETELPEPLRGAEPTTIGEIASNLMSIDKAKPSIPSLGSTGREIYQGWKDLTAKGQPPRATIEGFVPGLGRFGFDSKGELIVLESKHLGRNRGYASFFRKPTPAEVNELHNAISKGQFQVEQRTIRGALGVREFQDAGALEKVFHRATGRPLPEYLDTPEGKAYGKRVGYNENQ